MNDLKVYTLALELLAECVTALNDTSNGAPARSYVAEGIPAHDNCCEGQLTVSIVRRYASTTFPQIDDRPAACSGPYLVVDFAIEAVRCAPVQDDNLNPPTVEALLASARQVEIDARAIWQAVRCWLYEERGRPMESLVGLQDSITPEGGCVGTRLAVSVGVLDGCKCP